MCVMAGSSIQYNTIQYIFGIETRPGSSQRADSPLMGSSLLYPVSPSLVGRSKSPAQVRQFQLRFMPSHRRLDQDLQQLEPLTALYTMCSAVCLIFSSTSAFLFVLTLPILHCQVSAGLLPITAAGSLSVC
jgi:hypothetical protein